MNGLRERERRGLANLFRLIDYEKPFLCWQIVSLYQRASVTVTLIVYYSEALSWADELVREVKVLPMVFITSFKTNRWQWG